MRERQADLDQCQAAVIAVTFERPAALERFGRLERLPYPVLSDPDRRLYAAFGLQRKPLLRLITRSVLATYVRGLGSGRWPRLPHGDLGQLGGDIVLDDSGAVVFVHRGQEAADRPPVEAILAAVRLAAAVEPGGEESG